MTKARAKRGNRFFQSLISFASVPVAESSGSNLSFVIHWVDLLSESVDSKGSCQMSTITEFISRHYRHFNAATLKDAAQGYQRHLEKGGKMLVTVAGAMSTAELGLSLAEMIRQDKIHAICCTGANLEEDVFNLVAHHHYKRIP